MKRMIWLLLALSGALCAQDLDALFERIKAENARLGKEQVERERRFKAQVQARETMLAEAKAELRTLQARSDGLRKTFDRNEARLAEREAVLQTRMGNLGEMFGVVRQNAGDLAGILRSSMVTAQFPEREAFVLDVSKRKRLPSASDLERLWLGMLQEMVESGKTATFEGDIVLGDGSLRRAPVTRVGLFTLASEGRYLRYDAESRKLIELPRQPASRYMRHADLSGGEEIVTAVIDPTRGSIFELMMEKPTLSERIAQGGFIGYAILVLGAAGVLLAAARLAMLWREHTRVKRQLLRPDAPEPDNVLGRVLGIYDANRAENVDVIESRLDEAVLKELPALTRGESLLKLLAAVAPLLGLLGTVVGMIATFQAITLFGTGDAKLMAGGISQALVTTMLGLVVAVPLLFAHSLLRSRSRVLVELLAQQSAGLIAQRMEQAR